MGSNNRHSEDENFIDEMEMETRREVRQNRKRASAKDRSKFKKTDQDKMNKGDAMHPNVKQKREDLKRGRIVSISGQFCAVDTEEGQVTCVLRGLLKHDKTQMKNLVTVGDFVLFDVVDGGEGVIVHVEERKSVLARSDNLSRRKQHLIAANIDQVLITFSCHTPPLKPPLVDRYIIATEKGNMTPILVFNKIDLVDECGEEEKALVEEFLEAYKDLPYRLLTVSTKTGEGMDDLREVMKDKASVFSGQSGVGKSSLINELTGLDLATGETVEHTRKGAHTTTQAQLFPLEWGGYVVDTPGIKSFGVWDLEQAELSQYFPDIQELASGCRFKGCLHVHEPDCAVKEAAEEGRFPPVRYDSYLMIFHQIQEKHLRR